MHCDAGVIALVPDHWDDIVMPRHQVLRRLAHHFPLVWLEPAPDWREVLLPSVSGFMRPDRWRSPVPGLHVMSPGWRHPNFLRPRWLRESAFRSRLVAARKQLRSMGAQRIALYIWRDEFANALELVAHDFACYHIDDEYSFSEMEIPNSVRESALLRNVDQVIVHSSTLLTKKGGINPHTALVPNGVDFRAFSQQRGEPADMASIPRPRVGYAGVIKKQLNLALLARLARARPGYSFVLVGPVLNVAGKEECIAELRRLPNVHFLGLKPPDDLPAYIQHFDVCLMCYELNDYTNYIFPLKLNEYLAAGRPVVSTPISTLKAASEVTLLARTDSDWLEAIDASLAASARSPASVERRQAFARRHDWDELVDQIAALFQEGFERRTRHRGVGGMSSISQLASIE